VISLEEYYKVGHEVKEAGVDGGQNGLIGLFLVTRECFWQAHRRFKLAQENILDLGDQSNLIAFSKDPRRFRGVNSWKRAFLSWHL
jgi:hypothetical protein